MSLEDKKNRSKVGLVVVHGIGNQRPGDLARVVARNLGALVPDIIQPGDATLKLKTEVLEGPFKPNATINLKNSTVLIHEAHWADLSDPDNRPKVILASGLFRIFFDTLKQVWFTLLFPGINKGPSRLSKLYFSLFGVLTFFLLLALNITVTPGLKEELYKSLLIGAQGLLFLAYFLYLLRRALRYRQLSLRRANIMKRLLYYYLDLNFTLFRFAFGMIALELLLFYVIAASVVVLFGYACWILVFFPQRIGDFFDKISLNTFRKWVHRLGAVLFVLPAQSAQQTIKAVGYLISVWASEKNLTAKPIVVGNLIAIYSVFLFLMLLCAYFISPGIFMPLSSQFPWLEQIIWIGICLLILITVWATEKNLTVKPVVVGNLIAIVFVFLLLTLFCEFLILMFIMPFFVLFSEAVPSLSWKVWAIWITLIGIYLLILKLFLPIIDVILDISNYHLAEKLEHRNTQTTLTRRKYFKRLSETTDQLLKAGCSKIYFLSHSLGSVITYDWLHTVSDKSYPIAGLYTIGSPLDDFWYMDHSRDERKRDVEGLDQKIVGKWINFWSRWSDPISGNLKYYGISSQQVMNHRLRWLGVWPCGHMRYWKNKVVMEVIRQEMDGLATSDRGDGVNLS